MFETLEHQGTPDPHCFCAMLARESQTREIRGCANNLGICFSQSTTRGVHHLALCTEDIKATIAMSTCSGCRSFMLRRCPGLCTGPANYGNPYEEVRHYFFHMGNDSLLAFFEIP